MGTLLCLCVAHIRLCHHRIHTVVKIEVNELVVVRCVRERATGVQGNVMNDDAGIAHSKHTQNEARNNMTGCV